MKTKSLNIVSALVIGVFVLGTAYAQQRDAIDTRTSKPGMEATAITKEDAQKKYPAAKGGVYPPGNRNPHDESGVVSSPYPPYQKYNCSKVNHGGLVLDVRAKKVFIYP